MRKAFTMVELIFVVVIIGILSTIAIPKFFSIENSAKEANVKKQIQAIRASIQSERAQRVTQDINVTQGSGGGQLWLYYNFQPWNGQTYTDGNSSILMNNVATFRYMSVGSLIKIQLCVSDANISHGGGYSICKEQTIF